MLRRSDGCCGNYRTLWRGTGSSDLADLREYQHADDVRPHRLERHRPAAGAMCGNAPRPRVTAWFVLDLTGSIDFGRAHQLAVKSGASRCWAGSLGMATRGAILTVWAAGAVPPAVPPDVRRGGRCRNARRDRCRRAAAGCRCCSCCAACASGGRDARHQTHHPAEGRARMMHRRSMVFVLSDFISAPGWLNPWAGTPPRGDGGAAVRSG